MYTESQEGAGVLETQVESTPSTGGEQSSDTAAQQEEVAPNTDQDINVVNTNDQKGTASSTEATAKGFAFIFPFFSWIFLLLNLLNGDLVAKHLFKLVGCENFIAE